MASVPPEVRERFGDQLWTVALTFGLVAGAALPERLREAEVPQAMDEEVRWIRAAYARHRLEGDRVDRASESRPTGELAAGAVAPSGPVGLPGRGPEVLTLSGVPHWFKALPGEAAGGTQGRWSDFVSSVPPEVRERFGHQLWTVAMTFGLTTGAALPEWL